MKCKECVYWQEWKDRVYARIDGAGSSMANNILELRRCHYRHHPTVNQMCCGDIYTDKDFGCDCFIMVKEKK